MSGWSYQGTLRTEETTYRKEVVFYTNSDTYSHRTVTLTRKRQVGMTKAGAEFLANKLMNLNDAFNTNAAGTYYDEIRTTLGAGGERQVSWIERTNGAWTAGS